MLRRVADERDRIDAPVRERLVEVEDEECAAVVGRAGQDRRGSSCCLTRSVRSRRSPPVTPRASTTTTSPSREVISNVGLGLLRRLPRLLAHALELASELLRLIGAGAEQRERLAGCDRLDTPCARADRRLAKDHERADLGRRPHVGAAAELARDALDLDHAHLVAVLLAEQHHRAEVPCLVDRHDERPHRVVGEDRLVDAPLDRLALLGGERLRVSEVEPELVRPHRRAGLVDVLAEHRPQRLVQEVGSRVIGHRREADTPRDDCLDPVAGLEALPLEEQRLVVLDPVGGEQRRPRAVVLPELAGVGDLAATLRVEGRLAQLRQEQTIAELIERADLGEHLGLLPADELGGEARRAREVDGLLDLALPAARPRHLTVSLHLLRIRGLVDGDAALTCELERQLDREAVGGLELERVLAADRAARGRLLEQLHPTVEGLGEAFLLGAEDPA